MKAYERFAEIYDYLMQYVDYEAWMEYLEQLLARYGFEAETVADLACGTGNTSIPLARKGFRVIGIDLSPQMLDIAGRKSAREGLDIVFQQGDLRDFILGRPVDLMVSFQDGFNYLLSMTDLNRALARVRAGLKPGGLFVFDLNGVNRLADGAGETTFIEEENLCLVWQTSYLQSQDIWEIRLTGFVRRREELYEKFTEVHRENSFVSHEFLQ
jgi:SAM-dependent methyltransferase